MQRRQFSGPRPIINSVKNIVESVDGVLAVTNLTKIIAVAVDNPDPSASLGNEVNQGSIIKALHIEFWYYGNTAGDTNDIVQIYLMKDPGANLSPPNPGTVGQSNERKFVIKTWRGLAGVKSLGGTPYVQRGHWIKIPKRYQRMGIDDRWLIVVRSATIGNFCLKTVYKHYT